MHLPRIPNFSQVLKQTESHLLCLESMSPGFYLGGDARAEEGCLQTPTEVILPACLPRPSAETAEPLVIRRPRTAIYSLF